MTTTGTARAKELPRSATITVHRGKPQPSGEVEVAPDIGEIHFRNADRKNYRVRFFRKGTEFNPGINIVLPTRGTITVSIRRNDEFFYEVFPLVKVSNGQGGGPIRN